MNLFIAVRFISLVIREYLRYGVAKKNHSRIRENDSAISWIYTGPLIGSTADDDHHDDSDECEESLE
jgi:hypothetical protein